MRTATKTHMSPTDSLFFAVFPDAATAKSIEIFSRELRAEHGVIGKPLAARRFHVSLHHLGNYHGLPADAVTLAEQAAAAVALPPFELTFDHVMSFKGRPGNQPLVLDSSGGLPALSALHKTLYDLLKPTVFEPFVQLRFKPHLTLLYGEHRIAQAVDEITWIAREFVLVHSLLGRTQYKLLSRWPLRG